MATKKKPDLDITKHVLVPKHTKLTKKDAQKLLEDYGITLGELLKIQADDPAIANLDVQEGDIVKIERKGGWQSLTAGSYECYRGVINAKK